MKALPDIPLINQIFKVDVLMIYLSAKLQVDVAILTQIMYNHHYWLIFLDLSP